MSTAVAVLSPRAREGATVSMPLTWAQVRADLDPKKYTVRTVPALLAKTKAWEGYDDAAASIKAAMKKLAGSSNRDTPHMHIVSPRRRVSRRRG